MNSSEGITPQVEFITIFCETVEENCNLESKLSLKELSDKGGLYAETGEGFADTMYYNKSSIRTIPVLILCRHKSLDKGLNQLNRICNYLQRLKKYPRGKMFSWLDTKIAKEPNKIGRDEDGMYNLSCILNCRIYF